MCVWCWFLCSKITHKVIYCIQSCCMQHINTLAMISLSYIDIVVGAVRKYEPPPPKHHSCLSQTDSWWRNGKAGTHKSRLNCSINAYGMVYPILFAQGPNLTQIAMKNMTAIVCSFYKGSFKMTAIFSEFRIWFSTSELNKCPKTLFFPPSICFTKQFSSQELFDQFHWNFVCMITRGIFKHVFKRSKTTFFLKFSK